MFDEKPVMDSEDLIKVLFKLFILHHYFPIILLLPSNYSILVSDLGSGPEKVAQIPESLA